MGSIVALTGGSVGCAPTSPLAQTSRPVATQAAPTTTVDQPEVASRQAPVPAVTHPDEMIVYIRAGSIWRVPAAGGQEPQQLTSRADDGPDRGPAVDRRGRMLAYAAATNGGYRIRVLHLEEADSWLLRGAQPTPPNQPPGEGDRPDRIDDQPTWSPDGQRVAYMSGNPYEHRHLVVQDVATGDSEILVAGSDAHPDAAGMPAWSPDGRHIAFAADRGHGKGTLLWLVEVDSKRLRPLTTPLPGAGHVRDRDPAFSPDGRRVVFASNRHAASADAAGDFDIYSVAADGTELRRLTDDPGVASDPVYSVDGQRILFVSTRGRRYDYETEIYVMAAGGGKQRRLTRDDRPENSAPFSVRAK